MQPTPSQAQMKKIKNIATYSQPGTDEEDQAVLVFHFELSLHLVLRLATHIKLSLEAYDMIFS